MGRGRARNVLVKLGNLAAVGEDVQGVVARRAPHLVDALEDVVHRLVRAEDEDDVGGEGDGLRDRLRVLRRIARRVVRVAVVDVDEVGGVLRIGGRGPVELEVARRADERAGEARAVRVALVEDGDLDGVRGHQVGELAGLRLQPRRGLGHVEGERLRLEVVRRRGAPDEARHAGVEVGDRDARRRGGEEHDLGRDRDHRRDRDGDSAERRADDGGDADVVHEVLRRHHGGAGVAHVAAPHERERAPRALPRGGGEAVGVRAEVVDGELDRVLLRQAGALVGARGGEDRSEEERVVVLVVAVDGLAEARHLEVHALVRVLPADVVRAHLLAVLVHRAPALRHARAADPGVARTALAAVGAGGAGARAHAGVAGRLGVARAVGVRLAGRRRGGDLAHAVLAAPQAGEAAAVGADRARVALVRVRVDDERAGRVGREARRRGAAHDPEAEEPPPRAAPTPRPPPPLFARARSHRTAMIGANPTEPRPPGSGRQLARRSTGPCRLRRLACDGLAPAPSRSRLGRDAGREVWGRENQPRIAARSAAASAAIIASGQPGSAWLVRSATSRALTVPDRMASRASAEPVKRSKAGMCPRTRSARCGSGSARDPGPARAR